MDDVLQNANLSKETLCRGVNECCEFRKGFVNGWKTQYEMELFSKIKDCVSRCDDDNICLIISGHSQGGAIATAASLLELSALTTYYEVITFAAPPALTLHPSECAPHMDFDRHYRFGKGLYKDLESGGGASGLVFDKVPFLGPDPIPGFESFSVGEFIVLSSEDQ